MDNWMEILLDAVELIELPDNVIIRRESNNKFWAGNKFNLLGKHFDSIEDAFKAIKETQERSKRK